MSDVNEYLKRLDEIKGKSNFREVRKVYKKIDNEYMVDFYAKAIKYLDFRNTVELEKERAEVQAVAYKMFKNASPMAFIKGAMLYEKLGKGRKIIPELMKRVEKEKDIMSKQQYDEVRDFVKRNSEDEKQGGLAGKLSVFILFVIGGVALVINSLNLTGLAVSNITQTAPKLSGLLFFIAGLVGIFLVLKK